MGLKANYVLIAKFYIYKHIIEWQFNNFYGYLLELKFILHVELIQQTQIFL